MITDTNKILKIKEVLSLFSTIESIYFSPEITFRKDFSEYALEKRDIYSCAIVNDFSEIPQLLKGSILIILNELVNLDQLIDNGFTLIKSYEKSFSVLCYSGTIDIILPTWNAYEYVVDCVNSIYQNTDNVPYRLILVDDCSSDKRIYEFFKKVKRSKDIYLLNEKNVGFVKTCNHGIAQSDVNDIVLQNTDTVVTPNWLSNMIKGSYQDNKIGICNPISNNASIYSIKEFEKANLEPTEIVRILQEYPNNMVLEVPIAVGFCFYVKRDVINKVGMLDEAFGRGYGEENDLCLKAYLAGYKSIIVDDSFVFHKGSISMILSGDMKKNHPDEISTKPEHEKILLDRYPFFPKLIEDKTFQNNLYNFLTTVKYKCFSKLAENRKKVLYLLHSDPFSCIGGTEIHVTDLSKKISTEFSVFVLFPTQDQYGCYEYYNGIFVNKYIFSKIINYPEYTLNNTNIKNLYEKIFTILDIDILHIHHFKNNTIDCVDVAKSLGIPIFYTMHDYYSVDPNHNLSFKLRHGNYEEDYIPDKSYYEKFSGQIGFEINSWHSKMEIVLKKCDLLLSPSQTVKNEIQKFYEIENIDVRSIPMWISEPENKVLIKLPNNLKRLCFLGGVNTEIKGKYIIEKIIPELIKKNYEIHFLGSTDQGWNLPKSSQIIFHGIYERKDVINKLHEINPSFVLILSIVHESFSYTLSESFKAGIPVICTPMGAVAERVSQTKFGYIAASNSVEDILNEIIKRDERDSQIKVIDPVQNNDYIDYLRNNYIDFINQSNKIIPRKKSDLQSYLILKSEVYNKILNFQINSRQHKILQIYSKLENIFLNKPVVKKILSSSKLKNILTYIYIKVLK